MNFSGTFPFVGSKIISFGLNLVFVGIVSKKRIRKLLISGFLIFYDSENLFRR